MTCDLYCSISLLQNSFLKIRRLFLTCVWLIRHLTTAVHLWQKTTAVFDMCMSMFVHLRSWSTAPLISGFKVSKQIIFGMGSLGSIPSYLASEIQDRKGEFTHTHTHTHTERERERERDRDRTVRITSKKRRRRKMRVHFYSASS